MLTIVCPVIGYDSRFVEKSRCEKRSLVLASVIISVAYIKLIVNVFIWGSLLSGKLPSCSSLEHDFQVFYVKSISVLWNAQRKSSCYLFSFHLCKKILLLWYEMDKSCLKIKSSHFCISFPLNLPLLKPKAINMDSGG